MKLFRFLSVLLAIAASSSYAMAEGGGDRTFARMEQARQVSIAAYQADQKDQAQEVASKAAPAAKHAKC
nr:co-regulatory protein PtrA N-terminal domain-containing protein [uncultured Halomonas sp.]